MCGPPAAGHVIRAFQDASNLSAGHSASSVSLSHFSIISSFRVSVDIVSVSVRILCKLL